MKSRNAPIFIGIVLLAALTCLAWTPRPAFNRVASVTVFTSGSSLIPTYFTRRIPGYNTRESSVGASVQSLVMTGLANNGYSHLMVLNNTGASLTLYNTDQDLSAGPPQTVPSEKAGNVQGQNRFFVLANNNNSWDDLSIFDAIYIRSNGASVNTTANVDIMVW